MAKPNTPTDALPLLAYKIAPRQFDVSYRFAHISLRDQIVRAQMLVRTLLEMDLVKASAHESCDAFQLLICGAGAAGLAAAKEADALGVSFVLIEKGVHAPGGVLRSSAERYVSTAMYEWPHPNHTAHEFPLAMPELLGAEVPPMPALQLTFNKPVRVKAFGDELGKLLKTDIRRWRQNFNDFADGKHAGGRSLFTAETELDSQTKDALKATLNEQVSIHGVPLKSMELPEVRLQHLRPRSSSAGFRFQFVIYAVGFAEEEVNYADEAAPYAGYIHNHFWKPDLVRSRHLGFSKPPRVGILGSGDGALQDALRCLTNEPHPLAVWNKLMACPQKGRRRLLHSPKIRMAMAEIAAADGYTTAGAIWSHSTHIFKSLDEAFRGIIKKLIDSEGSKLRVAVSAILRSDVQKVTIINRDGYFTRAYALNRFLVLLLDAVLNEPERGQQGRLEILFGDVTDFTQLDSDCRGATLTVMNGSNETRECELVIIRVGLNNASPPTQLVGLSGMDTGRAELGRIPPAIRPIGKC